MNWAIIGAGGVGAKRAKALGKRLKLVADPDLKRAQALGPATTEWKDVLTSDVEAVVIATPNHLLNPIALTCIQAGKHVLIEKPGARTAAELREIREAATKHGVIASVGYNHVFHPAISVALKFAKDQGDIMFLRGRYGHGGRLGYDREWRANPEYSGGGELIDQGVHLIHIARLLMGDFPVVEGHVATYFWDMAVEDNAFVSLRTADGRTAWLHASCTEWKNMFSLEIYWKTVKMQIDGLGGSYGTEKVTIHAMKPEMGPPETRSNEFPGEDLSWYMELEEFGKTSNLDDAIAVLEIVEKVYGR